MTKYEELAKQIIEKVGGRENIASVTHCITRLRFKLREEEKADTKALKIMPGVITVVQSNGQYQVVIGNHVPQVYKEVLRTAGIEEGSQQKEEKSKGLFAGLIDIISAIFAPILGVLCATGMIKGVNALFLFLGWLSESSVVYQVLQIIGDSLFYFLPVFLGYTSAKKFHMNLFTGIAVGAALVHPLTAGVTGTDYSSTVIPVILAVWFASKAEKVFTRVIPDVLKLFIVPLATLLVTVPVSFLVIGPVSSWLADGLGAVTTWIYDLSPLLAGLFVGGFWQVFVIFGVHWGLVPVGINNIAALGYDTVLTMSFAASFAQIGVVLAIFFRTRDKTLRSASIPAFISGLFGVTEPAIYGVTLPRKAPFIISCIAAGVGGGIIGLLGVRGYVIGGLGIFGFANFIDTANSSLAGVYGAIWACGAAFALGFFMEFFLFRKENQEQQTEEALELKSPLTGEVIALTKVPDELFAQGTLGDGVGIRPSVGEVYAPAEGTVTNLFATGHALGFTAVNGAEILIHVGIDTVELNGKYFEKMVREGDKVKVGQLLLRFDINAIKSAGYHIITPVIVTNTQQFCSIDSTSQNEVTPEDTLMWLNKKTVEGGKI